MFRLKTQKLAHAYGTHSLSPSPVPAVAGPAQAPGTLRAPWHSGWLCQCPASKRQLCLCLLRPTRRSLGHRDLHSGLLPRGLASGQSCQSITGLPTGTVPPQNKWRHMADGYPIFCHSRTSLGRRPRCLLPALYRTEDYFPADSGQAAP